MQNGDELVISGTDVEALFPSLRDVESAKVVIEAVLKSSIKIENFDWRTAIKYLYIVGGPTHLKECGLERIAPNWLGTRPDLLTVGGESGMNGDKWYFRSKSCTEKEEKLLVARVLELAVLVCMGTYAYSFQGHLYLQREGGPIWMRFTVSLANLVMKMWDCAFATLAEKTGVRIKLFLRYVDNCIVFLNGFKRGWMWDRKRITFSMEEYERDQESYHHTVRRTKKLITGMMCSIAYKLRVIGEDCTQFEDNTLPTLDTALWVENGRIEYKFYEKPTVGNQVLSKETALPVVGIRASLVQETVRRLLNCSQSADQEIRTNVLNKLTETCELWAQTTELES